CHPCRCRRRRQHGREAGQQKHLDDIHPYSKRYKDDNGDVDTDCLIHGCTRFSSPITFLCLAVPVYVAITASSTYLGGCISTIEKQFQISSSKSGLIATINDIVTLSLVIFVTYYGSKYHRPRILSVAGIIVGIGIFLLSLPHFTSDPLVHKSHVVFYNETQETEYVDVDVEHQLCHLNKVVEDACTSGESSEEVQSSGVFWLVIGQIFIGIGGAPLFPLILTYLDDSTVDSSTTSIYIAAIFMSIAFGPFLGFTTSFKCLSLYVDFHRVDEDDNIPTDPSDPRWIGAWWLGFVIFSALIMMFSIPLFFFPRQLKKYECSCFKRKGKREALNDDINVTDVYSANIFQDKDKGLIASVKGLMKAVKRIVTNPTVIFAQLMASCELAIVAGFAFFTAKYFEKQFAISAATASIVLGGINLPGSVLANILSSFFVKRFKLKQYGLSRLLIIFGLSSLVFGIPLLFIGCSNPRIAGATVQYNVSYKISSLPDSNSYCNSDCVCSDRVYTPVCGSNGMTYTSACHAGCVGVWEEDFGNDVDDDNTNKTVFFGCSCIDSDDTWQAADGLMVEGGVATEGSCDWSCDKILPFAILIAVVAVFGQMQANPNVMLTLRCVDSEDRGISLAFLSVIIRILGFFPAPIYFGAAISSTCLIRQESCNSEGVCLVYDLEQYRYTFIGLFIALKFLSAVLSFCTYFSINPDRLQKNKSKPMELMRKDIVRKQNQNENSA
ncbi:solute carrier organic anion transporter family member 2A1-like, partial [Antedon mediterranea]|uniref:solute carrier organic anion transporter family member 2A1-like n=1 Tax=Antedon mediterranea TaxID=105859 RepID=UPI003AF7E1AD